MNTKTNKILNKYCTCVEYILHAAHLTDAPSSTSVSIKTAVCAFMCVQPTIRAFFNGLSSRARLRNAIMPGISARKRKITINWQSSDRILFIYKYEYLAQQYQFHDVRTHVDWYFVRKNHCFLLNFAEFFHAVKYHHPRNYCQYTKLWKLFLIKGNGEIGSRKECSSHWRENMAFCVFYCYGQIYKLLCQQCLYFRSVDTVSLVNISGWKIK